MLTLTLRQYLLIFRAHYKLALAVMLAVVAIAVPVILMMPKQYTATTSLVVEVKSPDPITLMLMPNNVATQEDIIKSDRVSQRVVRTLGLDKDAALYEQWRDATGGKGAFDLWLAGRLQRRLTVNPARRDGNIITIQYKASDPVFAASAANAFAQGYVDAMVEMKVEPAKQYARWFGEQGKPLRENLEAAEARLSQFLQRKGIVTKDEALDAETTKLNELMSQLTAAQALTVDARTKQRGAAGTLSEVQGNTVILGLRGEIARLEAKLKDAGGNLGSNHPQYRSMEAELAELKARLEAETRYVASSFSTARSVGVDKEKELKAAIEAQKRKLLALRAERDELAVLQRDVDAAKNAYEAVEKRYTQTNLESQATQTNVFVLRPAVEPLEPSSPKLGPYTLAAILFGVMLGLGSALAIEALDRRVRCADDVSAILQMPVLAVVGPPGRGTPSLQMRPAPLTLK
jgi:chain length determinant protein EpsF